MLKSVLTNTTQEILANKNLQVILKTKEKDKEIETIIIIIKEEEEITTEEVY